MPSSVFTFRPTKDKLLPFERRFSKRETTVRKWTFARDADNQESVNKSNHSRRSELSSRLDNSSTSKIPVPAVLKGVVLPSSTPEGSENCSDLDSPPKSSDNEGEVNSPPQSSDNEGEVNSPPQSSDNKGEVNSPPQSTDTGSDINTKTLRPRTKQTKHTEDQDGLSSSCDARSTDHSTLNSNFTLLENSSQSETFRSTRKRPHQAENIESEKSNKSEILGRSLRKIQNQTQEIESENTVQSDSQRSLRKRPQQSRNIRSEKFIQSVEQDRSTSKISQQTDHNESESITQSNTENSTLKKREDTDSEIEKIYPKKRLNQQQDNDPEKPFLPETRRTLRKRPQEGESEILRSLRKRQHDTHDHHTEPLKQSESPRRSSRKKANQTFDRSLEKTATQTKISQKIGMSWKIKLRANKDKKAGSNNKQKNEDSEDDTEITSLNQSVHCVDDILDKTNVRNQRVDDILDKPNVRNQRRSSRLHTKVASPKKYNLEKMKKASAERIEDTVYSKSSQNDRQIHSGDKDIPGLDQTDTRLTQRHSVTVSIETTCAEIKGQNGISVSSLQYKENNTSETLENMSSSEQVSEEKWNSDRNEDELSKELIEQDRIQIELRNKISNNNMSKSPIPQLGPKEHVSTAVNPVDISHDKVWKNTSLAKPKEDLVTVNVNRDIVTGNNLTSKENMSNSNKRMLEEKRSAANKMSSEENTACEESEDLMEVNNFSSESREDGNLSAENIFHSSPENIESKNTSNSNQQLKRSNKSVPSLSGKNDHDCEPLRKKPKALSNMQPLREDMYNLGEKQIEDGQESNNREILHGTEYNGNNTDDEDNNDRVQGHDEVTDNTGKTVELESILVTSDSPRRKSPAKNVKKKVRIISDETEPVSKEHSIKMWKGRDDNRTSRDVMDLDIVLDKVTDIIEEHRSACGSKSGKKALNSLLVYTRKEMTEKINKIEDIKYDKKELSGTRHDVKFQREKLLTLQQERSSLAKQIKEKKQDEKTKLKSINKWFVGMVELVKVKKNPKSPRKVEYITYGNFPLDIDV